MQWKEDNRMAKKHATRNSNNTSINTSNNITSNANNNISSNASNITGDETTGSEVKDKKHKNDPYYSWW
jgi:hypothetical protein